MRIAVIIGTVALAATTFTTTAYASAAFGNLGKDFSKIHSRGSGNMDLKFPDFEIKMKPSKTKNKKNAAGSRHNVPEDHSNKPTPPQTPQVPQTPAPTPQTPASESPYQNWRPDNWANEPHNPYGGLYGPGT